ncbi:MAG: 16S rRNA (uracil(1498)-N(3))-methyltransferase [Gammaproteobacteria bacterium]|nr:16S rRNA (uracil(1498)-N(3))-methyltransferase [Gammaproteobacteria bacterium]
MRAPRIYQPVPLATGQIVELNAQATAHLTRVLRLRVGDALVVFNGEEGGEYAARVREVGRRAASIDVGEFVDGGPESPLELVLVQGISRGERMDYTVQKAVELGVSRIVPVLTERTVVNLKGDRVTRRREHWQSVVNSACEQSGRNRVPVVAEPLALADYFKVCESSPSSGLGLVLHHRAGAGLAGMSSPQGPVTLLVGPEGGLSGGEITRAEDVGFLPLRLGPRVLRTETAAVASLAVLQWLWGDFTGPVSDCGGGA